MEPTTVWDPETIDHIFHKLARGKFHVSAELALRERYLRLLQDRVFTFSDWRCRYCGCDLLEDLDSLFMATKDHIIPRAAGGPDDPSNLAASCTVCNQLKAAEHFSSIPAARAAIMARRRQHARWFDILRRTYRAIEV